ncbi:MAG: D-2-hydroxyacid dehydrogenase [Chloroflexota bacterium]|nr:D-2-hydroxyacid dehydrogenase [Chloroflexota bacterium]
MSSAKTTVVIASPFEEEYVARMRAVAPDRVDIIFPTDLLPPARYVADHDGPADFTRSPEDQQRWLETLARADVLFCVPREAKTNLLSLCPRLKWLQGTSAGMGQPAQRLGLIDSDVIVTTASGIHGGPLAEFVFAALLSQTRNLAGMAAQQAAHTWTRFTADELAGKTMLIVGAGRIGRQIIRVAKAFDMHVIAVGRSGTADRATDLGADRFATVTDLHTALPEADVVVIVTPHTGQTDSLIGAHEFDLMKPGVTFINIGRGAVVDEAAMTERLADGRIGFAALDVFQVEPLPAGSPLWDMPNVLISPHCSANAPRENERITDIFVRNLALFIDGRYDEMSPVLDKTNLY